jgi:hypothetical protein
VVVGAGVVRQGAYNWVRVEMLDKISVEGDRWADLAAIAARDAGKRVGRGRI